LAAAKQKNTPLAAGKNRREPSWLFSLLAASWLRQGSFSSGTPEKSMGDPGSRMMGLKGVIVEIEDRWGNDIFK